MNNSDVNQRHQCAERSRGHAERFFSRRGDVYDVTSGTTYSLLGVFFFFLSFYLFYSSSNLSRYSSDLRNFYRTRVMPQDF